MKKEISHPVYGQIVYEENIWTGKKTVCVNGTPLRQLMKNTYTLPWGATEVPVITKGGFMGGVVLQIESEEIRIFQKPTWYDWALCLLPFLLIVIWGNSVQLCSIVPVVGGALGGGLGGAGLGLAMALTREKPLLRKIVIALLVTAGTFAVGAALGFAVLMALV